MTDQTANVHHYSGNIDAVFEGGGVKGIGLVGAVRATEEQNCTFVNVAGTSAGAIVAALVAAGYSADELELILKGLNFRKFLQRDFFSGIPGLGPILSVGLEKGLYEGDYFEEWLRELLARKNVHTFSDLILQPYANDERYRYKLQVIATDVTHCRMLRLPHDIKRFGRDPDQLDVAFAVRMSMSIPFFFEPVTLQDQQGRTCYIVDGGVVSSFPVWLFDTPKGHEPEWPTIGFKLVEGDQRKVPQDQWQRRWEINGPISMFGALISTMLEANDARYIEDREFARTIPIPTDGVSGTDFGLSPQQVATLYQSGLTAGRQFWESFDFSQWKERYRSAPAHSRSARVRP